MVKMDPMRAGPWVMLLVTLGKEGIYTDVVLYHKLLTAWLLFATNNWNCWSQLQWPVYLGKTWYKALVPLSVSPKYTPPVLINQNISPTEVSEIVDLCLQAIKEDLSSPPRAPDVSSFLVFSGQGVVLRTGFVFEKVKGLRGNPYFQAIPPKGSLTEALIQKLRAYLPFGVDKMGMLLVRATNIRDIPQTAATAGEVTPWHTDLPQYGRKIYATALLGRSCLIWNNGTRDKGFRTPVVSVPDAPGTVTFYTGDMVVSPWVHCVPNSSLPRISVTWRPETDADAQ